MPKVENNLDLSNIDRYFTREEPKETPEDDSSILKKEKFEQFTYIDDNGFINHKNSLNNEDEEEEFEDDNNDNQKEYFDDVI